MHHRAGTLAAAFVLAALLYIGATPLGPAPPLGGFLDPARGVWGVARSAELPERSAGTIAGLEGEVRVIHDRRGVRLRMVGSPSHLRVEGQRSRFHHDGERVETLRESDRSLA